MREREDENPTRVAGNQHEVESVVANTLNSSRNGAVGFIDWLDAFIDRGETSAAALNAQMNSTRISLRRDFRPLSGVVNHLLFGTLGRPIRANTGRVSATARKTKLLFRIRSHEFVFAKCLPLAVLDLPD